MPRDAADAAFCVLAWCDNLREDAELCDWLEVEGAPALDEAVLARAMAMVDVLEGRGSVRKESPRRHAWQARAGKP